MELTQFLAADLSVMGQLWAVLTSLAGLLLAIVQAILPWTPLIAWVAFWLLAVNWQRLYPVLMQGGWIGVALLMLMAILVWSSVSIPESGAHHFFGLHVNNIYVGKGVYVTGLTVIAILCGSAQLSGALGNCCRFIEPAADAEHGHGHDSHAHH